MTARSGTVDAGDSLPPFAGSAGDSAPALATNASGLIGWLRKINDTLAGASGGTSSTVSVSNFPATQPVSASALPLPSGAATSANQPALNGDGGGLAHVTNFPATQPVSAASLPLPSGAATDSNSNTLVGAAGTSPPALATSASGLIGWLRKIVDTLASTLTVSVSNASIAVTGTFWQATQPVSIATNTPDVTDRAARLVGHVTVDNASLAITAASLPLPAGAAQDATLTGGTQKNRITDGTNTAAVKAASTAPATTDPALVVVQGQNGYASTIARLLSAAATTNSTLVKGSAGRLFKIRGYNAKAAVAYLKLYNKATAPTVGTDTPVVTIPLKASDAFDIDFGAIGLGFATGIGFGLTGAVADADTTALVAADVVGLHIFYA